MQGKIIGEDEVDIGTEITDNGGVDHQIEMHKDSGEIYAHEQDGYPDKAAKRTPEGNEHVAQARRFAQYYVFTERGYNTVPAGINPDGLNAVRVAVAELSEKEFEQFFGDFYQQMRSHHADVDRPLAIPSEAADPDSVLYRTHIYLGLDPFDTELRDETQRLADEHGLDLSRESFKDISLSDMAADGLRNWAGFADDVTDQLLGAGDVGLTEGLHIETVSDLHMAYLDSRGREHVTDYEPPVERAADAQLEIPVMEFDSLSNFQDYLVHNLACQIRDSFIRMGLEPPEPFKLLGYGRYEAAERYEKVKFYANYIDPDEEHAFA